MERQNIFIALGQALFAVFGSCVKWLGAKDKEPQRFVSFMAEIVSAAFSGFLVYCIYAWLEFNIYIAFAIAGIIGHQGAKGLDLLGKFIVKNSVFRDVDEGSGGDSQE